MIKRNLSPILTSIAMILIILNFGYGNVSSKSTDFWLSLVATLVLIGASINILKTENKK